MLQMMKEKFVDHAKKANGTLTDVEIPINVHDFRKNPVVEIDATIGTTFRTEHYEERNYN